MMLKSLFFLSLFLLCHAANSTKNVPNITQASTQDENATSKELNSTLTGDNSTFTNDTEDLLRWLQDSVVSEVDDLKEMSENFYNESRNYWDQVMVDPCIQNGEVIISTIIGFVIGSVISTILVFCCFKMSRRSYQIQNRRIRTVSPRERKVNITDLAHLMDRDQDSEMEV